MEELDVLDENGNKTGIKKLRKLVHRDGDWHKTAFIFVVNDKGEIILQKRSKEKENDPNKWTASASGHLEAGDSDTEGAIRELGEEIGVNVNEDELNYLITVKEQWNIPEKDMKIRHISNVYIVFKNTNLDDLILQKEEVSEVKYVYYKDFEKMLINKKDEIVQHDEIYSTVLKYLHEKFDNIE